MIVSWLDPGIFCHEAIPESKDSLPKILIVEDDTDMCFLIEEWLVKEKFTLEICHDGNEGYEYMRQGLYDAVILDWKLPGMTGLDICKNYRAAGGEAPILMLTGKNELTDKEQGLDSGADDYLCKPFHMRELSARLRALLRRSPSQRSGNLIVGDLEMDSEKHALYQNGHEVYLNRREYDLLEFLMRNAGKIFTSEALLQRVWTLETDVSTNAVRTTVLRLRHKLDGGADEKDSIIENVPKLGYRLRERKSVEN